MKVVDSRTMTEIDRSAQEEFGFPAQVLLENAGLKAYQLLKERYWDGALPHGVMTVVAGKGNNGGDALVIARQCFLEGKRDLAIVTTGSPDPVQIRMCERLGIPTLRWEGSSARDAISRAAIIVDGLTGTGITGALRSPLDSVVEAINASRAFVVAVDVPSGIGDQFRRGFPAVNADVTLTMGLPKLCLYMPSARPCCGEIHVVPIGFPPALIEAPELPGELLSRETVRALVPPLPRESFKNRRGTLAVFGGAAGTTGAAVLSANAASRSRAGLVSVFADPAAYLPIAAHLSGVMTKPWDPRASPSSVDLDGYNAVLIGPGWGQSEDRIAWLKHLLERTRGVVDADGINLLAAHRDILPAKLEGRFILTPHPGEYHRLSGVAKETILNNPLPSLLELSRDLEAVIVLKSHVTLIASPSGRFWVLDGMTPALGTGGSGDLLAGIIAGFAAGGMELESAACAGSWVHLEAGRSAFAELGWFNSEDLLPYISRAAAFGAERNG